MKRVRRRLEKPKTWYHEELEKAGLPTSEISEKSMRAGIEYGQTMISAKRAAAQASGVAKPPAPRRNRNKPTIDPKKGLVISEETATALIAAGARDGTGGKLAGLANTKPAFTMPSSSSGVTQAELQSSVKAKQNNAASNAKLAQQPRHSSSETASTKGVKSVVADPAITDPDLRQRWDSLLNRSSIPMPGAPVVASSTPQTSEQGETSKNEDDSPLSELSSDEPEDPTDTSFGMDFTLGRSAPQTTKVVPSNKRKSVSNAGAVKRFRLGLDGGPDVGFNVDDDSRAAVCSTVRRQGHPNEPLDHSTPRASAHSKGRIL